MHVYLLTPENKKGDNAEPKLFIRKGPSSGQAHANVDGDDITAIARNVGQMLWTNEKKIKTRMLSPNWSLRGRGEIAQLIQNHLCGH